MPALQGMPQERHNRDEEYQNRNHYSDESTIEGVHGKEEISSDNETSTANYPNGGAFGEAEGNAVNIEEAMSNYEEIRRELTQQSRISRRKSMTPDQAEKGDVKDFDLTDFLREQTESSESQGFHPKHMGVVWKDLVVQGLGADAKTIPTNWTWIRDSVQFWKWGKHEGHDFTILKGNDGFCKDGEMLLVLGKIYTHTFDDFPCQQQTNMRCIQVVLVLVVLLCCVCLPTCVPLIPKSKALSTMVVSKLESFPSTSVVKSVTTKKRISITLL